MESHDDHCAQQLAPSSVAISAYAHKIIKFFCIKYGGKLNFVPGYMQQTNPFFTEPVKRRLLMPSLMMMFFCII